MRQSLQLKMGQSLTMTPQLQQAIRLLQLSTLELQQEVQEILETNLMLEEGTSPEPDSPNDSSDLSPSETPSSDSGESTTEANLQELESPEAIDDNPLPGDLPVDTEWEESFQPSPTASLSSSTGSGDFDQNSEARDGTTESLHDHLLWQLNLTHFNPKDQWVANYLIDAIAPSGLLKHPLIELHEGMLQQITAALGLEQATQTNEADIENSSPLDLEEVKAVLHRIQQFDPPGVAAQDLGECLAIQLQQLDSDTPWLSDAKLIVTKHLKLVASHDYKTLMRKTGIRENTLREALKLIQTLNPQPGYSIQPEETEYITPDVYVQKLDGKWKVSINGEISPRLRINQEYAALIKRADTSRDNTILKEHLQEARWFLKSLESRNETLLKVTSAIVEFQRQFLEYGEEAMKPLVLHEIAEQVDMHESTVSRVTTNKYLHTPRGVFELKYFFSSHVSTNNGGECSSTAIRALIKKLIDAEPAKKPLSDNKIAQLLEEQGIKVARRTIAKYREAMNIPPSNERKRLA